MSTVINKSSHPGTPGFGCRMPFSVAQASTQQLIMNPRRISTTSSDPCHVSALQTKKKFHGYVGLQRDGGPAQERG